MYFIYLYIYRPYLILNRLWIVYWLLQPEEDTLVYHREPQQQQPAERRVKIDKGSQKGKPKLVEDDQYVYFMSLMRILTQHITCYVCLTHWFSSRDFKSKCFFSGTLMYTRKSSVGQLTGDAVYAARVWSARFRWLSMTALLWERHLIDDKVSIREITINIFGTLVENQMLAVYLGHKLYGVPTVECWQVYLRLNAQVMQLCLDL